jgi:hypothetical protein
MKIRLTIVSALIFAIGFYGLSSFGMEYSQTASQKHFTSIIMSLPGICRLGFSTSLWVKLRKGGKVTAKPAKAVS